MAEKFTTFRDYMNTSSLTEDEKQDIQNSVELIGKIVMARHEQGMTQQELANQSGIKQPMIARIETQKSDPQLSTMLKILKTLGYKLAIVPDGHVKPHN